jgi:hypothetical protein
MALTAHHEGPGMMTTDREKQIAGSIADRLIENVSKSNSGKRPYHCGFIPGGL